MQQYLELMEKVLKEGEYRPDRTGTGTVSVFGHQMRFDLNQGFPLLTTKRLHVKSIIHELLWMLKGVTNIKYLQSHGVRIWDEWADLNGDLGPVYGKQWRDWNGIDQVKSVVHDIRNNPNSRRHIVNAWNVSDIPRMALPPCHVLFQFYVCNGKLSCQLYQRSADIFLGLPFNIASYALLTKMVAHVTGTIAHEFIHTIGDAHLYANHLEQAEIQLERDPRELPEIIIQDASIKEIDEFYYEAFRIVNYKPRPHIPAEVSV